jgi:two-component system, cell cycle sensor histidine kinase and response regulator CckA
MPKILVVEDDPIVQELCRAVLHREGFEAIIAGNGEEGLEKYLEKREEIALVLSDIIMPRMNGIEMIRNIFSAHAHANVIVMSGFPLFELHPHEASRLCGVLRKPFTHAQLLRAVNRCLKAGDD